MKLLGIALAMMVAQSSELPGAADATFEQRWESMVVKHQLRRYGEEDRAQRRVDKKTEVEDEQPRHRVREHRHRGHHAHQNHHRSSESRCRFGHPMFHGKSWRCRR